MKLAVTADIHFSAYAQDPIINELPERLGSLKDTITNMIEECGRKNVYDIAIAGDLCHNKSLIHTTAQNVMLSIFQNVGNTRYTTVKPIAGKDWQKSAYW